MAACAGRPAHDGAPRETSVQRPGVPGDAVPRDEPRSKYGNGPYYEVHGKTYRVMESSYGYSERGIASWYGRKFHGRPTSSREPYDMHAMTAAHKTLPLPTYVRVRNLKNNRSIVVRVNDRGPFVHNRLIDLSYGAAVRLDIVEDGTGMVEVTAISFDEPPRAAAAPAAPDPLPDPQPGGAPDDRDESRVYVQVGAFGDADNAAKRYAQLRDVGIGGAFVVEDATQTPALYRVRIGPIADVGQYDLLVDRLRSIGISDTHLVTD